jgi:hypothetical protein
LKTGIAKQPWCTKAKIDGLLSQAKAWREAKNLREFIQAVETAVGEQSRTEQFRTWSNWALSQADKLDPIRSGLFSF